MSAAAKQAARLAAMRLLAPADEYFGKLKMSILGIKNTIRDSGLRYDVNHDIAKQTITSNAFTEGAIHDWEHKYPKDGEVPRAIYYLQRLYAHIVDSDAQARAKATAAWLFADYPQSPQARQLKKVLASATPIPTDAPATNANPPAPGAVPPNAAPANAPAGTAPAQAAPASGVPAPAASAAPSAPAAPHSVPAAVAKPSAAPTTPAKSP
jgi:hypothetical protein